VAEGDCLGRARAAVPMPAEHIAPLRGAEVDVHHLMVAVTADWIEAEDETSVLVKRRRDEVEREGWEEEGGGFRSRMDTFPPASRMVIAVARPRPEEPPDEGAVLDLHCKGWKEEV
jgi:hypothetical protein